MEVRFLISCASVTFSKKWYQLHQPAGGRERGKDGVCLASLTLTLALALLLALALVLVLVSPPSCLLGEVFEACEVGSIARPAAFTTDDRLM